WKDSASRREPSNDLLSGGVSRRDLAARDESRKGVSGSSNVKERCSPHNRKAGAAVPPSPSCRRSLQRNGSSRLPQTTDTVRKRVRFPPRSYRSPVHVGRRVPPPAALAPPRSEPLRRRRPRRRLRTPVTVHAIHLH